MVLGTSSSHSLAGSAGGGWPTCVGSGLFWAAATALVRAGSVDPRVVGFSSYRRSGPTPPATILAAAALFFAGPLSLALNASVRVPVVADHVNCCPIVHRFEVGSTGCPIGRDATHRNTTGRSRAAPLLLGIRPVGEFRRNGLASSAALGDERVPSRSTNGCHHNHDGAGVARAGDRSRERPPGRRSRPAEESRRVTAQEPLLLLCSRCDDLNRDEEDRICR